MASATIAVIEDESIIAAAVAARLRREGFKVEIAGDGPSGVELCERSRPDLVVLDVMLPGFDGLEVCRRIQKDHPIPVIMLTARDSETDMLVGLGIGADDYMTKPFSPRELVARVMALLRRARSFQTTTADRPFQVGDLDVDPARRQVHRSGEEIHLTPIEFELFHTLAARPGVVFTRDQLLNQVWGYNDGFGARTIDSHVGALRRKLGSHLFRTVHGVGYAVDA